MYIIKAVRGEAKQTASSEEESFRENKGIMSARGLKIERRLIHRSESVKYPSKKLLMTPCADASEVRMNRTYRYSQLSSKLNINDIQTTSEIRSPTRGGLPNLFEMFRMFLDDFRRSLCDLALAERV
jgi:hypothetical protein